MPQITKSKYTHLDSCQSNICNNPPFWTCKNCCLCCSVGDKHTCGRWRSKASRSLLVHNLDAKKIPKWIYHKAWIRHSARPSPEELASVARSTLLLQRAICTLVSCGRCPCTVRPSHRRWKHTGGWIQRLQESSVFSFPFCEYRFSGFVAHQRNRRPISDYFGHLFVILALIPESKNKW